MAADGVAGVVTALATPPGSTAPAAVNQLAMIPSHVYGLPLIFWIGSAIYAVIFVAIFGSLVF